MGTRFFSRVKTNHEIKALAQDGGFIGVLENIFPIFIQPDNLIILLISVSLMKRSILRHVFAFETPTIRMIAVIAFAKSGEESTKSGISH